MTATTAPRIAPTVDAAHGAPGTFSPRRAARVAGISYLLMFALAMFANFTVREGLVERGDGAATLANISGSPGLFRMGLLAFLVVFVLDVVIAWALHVVFREVHRDLSLAAAWFRLVYAVFLGAGLVSFFQVLFLVGAPGIAADLVSTQTMLAMESFEAMWLIGLVAFGLHLVLVGVLIVRSGLMAKALGVVLAVAGIAYVADTVAHAVLSDYGAVATVMLAVVAVPSMLGEGWFGLSLLRARRIAG